MKKAYTQQELYDLYQAAKGGDKSALQTLRESSSYYGKKGNERIREFKAADTGSTALSRAEHFLQTQMKRNTFSRSKKLSAEEAYQNASEARRFMRSKTGTVKKETDRMSRVLEKLSELPTDPKNKRSFVIPKSLGTGEGRKQFEKFLKSSAWDEIKKTQGSEEMKNVADAIAAERVDIKEMLKAYEESFEDENFNILTFTREWFH